MSLTIFTRKNEQKHQKYHQQNRSLTILRKENDRKDKEYDE